MRPMHPMDVSVRRVTCCASIEISWGFAKMIKDDADFADFFAANANDIIIVGIQYLIDIPANFDKSLI